MATKVEAGADMKRTDLYIVNPYEIEVKEALRGRAAPPSEERVVELAESIFDYGQGTPVQVRRIEGNRLQLTMGYTRMSAIRLIRDGFTGADGQERCDPNFMIQTTVKDANDQEALTRNIIENRHRNNTTPIDDAVNQRILRDNYGKSDDEIAQLYRVSVQTVERTAMLLRLEDRERDLVQQGLMSVTAAIDLLELPSEKRAEVIAAATNEETGKVQGSKVRGQVRDHHLNDDTGGKKDPANAGPKRKKADDPAETPKKADENKAAKLKARTTTELKDFFRIQGTYEVKHAKFCRAVTKYIEGAMTNEKFEEILSKYVILPKSETDEG